MNPRPHIMNRGFVWRLSLCLLLHLTSEEFVDLKITCTWAELVSQLDEACAAGSLLKSHPFCETELLLSPDRFAGYCWFYTRAHCTHVFCVCACFSYQRWPVFEPSGSTSSPTAPLLMDANTHTVHPVSMHIHTHTCIQDISGRMTKIYKMGACLSQSCRGLGSKLYLSSASRNFFIFWDFG